MSNSLDPPFNEITAYSGRGIYSQSAGPVWLIGTAGTYRALWNDYFAETYPE